MVQGPGQGYYRSGILLDVRDSLALRVAEEARDVRDSHGLMVAGKAKEASGDRGVADRSKAAVSVVAKRKCWIDTGQDSSRRRTLSGDGTSISINRRYRRL